MVATGWLIAGGILLFILILLSIPVVVWFDYGETLRLRVRYLFFTVYQIPAKPKKRRKKKTKKKKKAAKAAEQEADKPQAEQAEQTTAPAQKDEKKRGKAKSKEKDPKKPTLSEIFELVKVAVESLSKPLKKLCRRINICDFDLHMICGGDDAAKAALNFGRMNLLVTNALGWLGSFFTLRRQQIDINVDFQSEETVTECSCRIKLSALAALAFAFTFLGRLIVRALKSEKIKSYLGRLRGKTAKAK